MVFARTDGALSRLSSGASWEVLEKWSVCQNCGVERAGMLFWVVKSSVKGLKQEGSQTWSLSFGQMECMMRSEDGVKIKLRKSEDKLLSYNTSNFSLTVLGWLKMSCFWNVSWHSQGIIISNSVHS